MTKADVTARRWVKELEESIGNKVSKHVPRGAGYDISVVESKGATKYIEAKGIEHSDTFFAINGAAGVRNLLSDNNYYIYFCDVKNDEILVTRGNFVLRSMGWSESEGSKKLISAWTETADAIKELLEINVWGRIVFTLKYPIRKLIKNLRKNPKSINSSILDTIVALWKREKKEWIKIYP